MTTIPAHVTITEAAIGGKVLLLLFVWLISGAALIEGIFNWPGMGSLYLEAALTRDYPLLRLRAG